MNTVLDPLKPVVGADGRMITAVIPQMTLPKQSEPLPPLPANAVLEPELERSTIQEPLPPLPFGAVMVQQPVQQNLPPLPAGAVLDASMPTPATPVAPVSRIPLVPPPTPPVPVQPPAEPGFIGRSVATVGVGFTQYVGSKLRGVSTIPGVEGVTDKWLMEHADWVESLVDPETVQMVGELTGGQMQMDDIWGVIKQLPKVGWYGLLQNAPQLFDAMVSHKIGSSIGGAIGLLGGPKGAVIGRPIGGFAMGAASAAVTEAGSFKGSVYPALLEQGLSEEDANMLADKYARLYGPAAGIIEYSSNIFQLGRATRGMRRPAIEALKKTPIWKMILDPLTGGLSEGGEELSQGWLHRQAANLMWDEAELLVGRKLTRPGDEDLRVQGVIGAAVGTMMGILGLPASLGSKISQTRAERKETVKGYRDQLKSIGLTDEQIGNAPERLANAKSEDEYNAISEEFTRQFKDILPPAEPFQPEQPPKPTTVPMGGDITPPVAVKPPEAPLATPEVSEVVPAPVEPVAPAVEPVTEPISPPPAPTQPIKAEILPSVKAGEPDTQLPVEARAGVVSEGTETKVHGTKGQAFDAKYAVVPHSELVASHDGMSFGKNPEYPLENPRDYSNPVEQAKVQEVRAEFSPAMHVTDSVDAAVGPVMAAWVTDEKGVRRLVVLGGNTREMAIQTMSKEKRQALADFTNKRTERFGVPKVDTEHELIRLMGEYDLRKPGVRKKLQGIIDALNPSPGMVQSQAEMAAVDAGNIPLDRLEDIDMDMSPKTAAAKVANLISEGHLDRRLRSQISQHPDQAHEYLRRVMVNVAFRDRKVADFVAKSDTKSAAARGLIEAAIPGVVELRAKGQNELADAFSRSMATMADYVRQGDDLRTALQKMAEQMEMDPAMAIIQDVADVMRRNVAISAKGRIVAEDSIENFKDVWNKINAGLKSWDIHPDMFGETVTADEVIRKILEKVKADQVFDNGEIRKVFTGARTAEPVRGIRAKQGQYLVDAMMKQWKNKPAGGAMVVQTEADLDTLGLSDESLQSIRDSRAEGFYHIPTETVVIIADNLKRPSDVIRVMVHESIGHYGIRKVLGTEFEAELERLGKLIPAEDMKKAVERYGKDLAVEEYLAREASIRNPTLWQQFIKAIREALKRIGIHANILEKWDTRGEIDRLVDTAIDYVERGEAVEPVVGEGVRLSIGRATGRWGDFKRGEKVVDEAKLRVYKGIREEREIYETQIKVGGKWDAVQYATSLEESRTVAKWGQQKPEEIARFLFNRARRQPWYAETLERNISPTEIFGHDPEIIKLIEAGYSTVPIPTRLEHPSPFYPEFRLSVPEPDTREFKLEQVSMNQLRSEDTLRKQNDEAKRKREELARRAAAPLEGTKGEMTADLFGEGETPLFDKRRDIRLSVPSEKSEFDKAVKSMPAAITASFDALTHKTLEDLKYLAEHELDLYQEGEETDIRNRRQADALKRWKNNLPTEEDIRLAKPEEPTTRQYGLYALLSQHKYVTPQLRKSAERAIAYEQQSDKELRLRVRKKMDTKTLEVCLTEFFDEGSEWTPSERTALGYELLSLHDEAFRIAEKAEDEQYARWHWNIAHDITEKLAAYQLSYGQASAAARIFNSNVYDTQFGAIQIMKVMNNKYIDSVVEDAHIKEAIRIGNRENVGAFDETMGDEYAQKLLDKVLSRLGANARNGLSARLKSAAGKRAGQAFFSRPENSEASDPDLRFSKALEELQDKLLAVAKYGARVIWQSGDISFTAFSQAMIKKCGPNVEKHLQQIYNESSIMANKIVTEQVAVKKGAQTRRLRSMNAEINSILKGWFAGDPQADRQPVLDLLQAVGLTKKDAVDLTMKVQHRFVEKAQKAKDRMLKKMMIGRTISPKSLKAVKQILELSNLTPLNDPIARNAISEIYGLPELTPEIADKLEKLAGKIKNAPYGNMHNNAVVDLLSFLQKQMPVSRVEKFWSWWYGNILSGYQTQERNFIGNFWSISSNLGTSMMLEPRNIHFAIAGFYGGMKAGGDAFVNTIKTGRSPIQHSRKFGPDSPIELDPWTGPLKFLNTWKYVTRTLDAFDALVFIPTREARSMMIMADMVRDENATDSAGAWAEVERRLGMTATQKESYRQQAIQDGARGREISLRVQELAEQQRPEKLMEETTDYSTRALFRQKPRGNAGVLSRMIEKGARKMPLLRLTIPFTHIVANVANFEIDHTPWGFVRAIVGMKDAQGNLQPITGHERAQLVAKATMGTAAMLAPYFLGKQGGDEDDVEGKLFDLYGPGPADYNKRAQWLETGAIPWSLRIGKTYFDIRLTPFAIGMSIMGAVRDHERWGKKGDDDSFLELVSFAVLNSASVIFNMTFVSGINQLMNMLDPSSPASSKRKVKTYLERMAGTTMPNLLKQLDRTFDNRIRDNATIQEALLRNVPIASRLGRPKINRLGEEIWQPTGPFSIFVRRQRDRPLWDLILTKEAWISDPNDSAKVWVEGEWKDGKKVMRNMTENEKYRYAVEGGREIRRRINSNLGWLQKAKKEVVKKRVQEYVRISRQIVKRKIRVDARNKTKWEYRYE